MVGIGSDEKWEQFVWKKEWSNLIATRQEVQEFFTKKTERRWDKNETKKGKKWIGKMKTEKEKVKWNESGWIARKKEQVQEVLAIKLRGSSARSNNVVAG